jgi:hypothetical protein
MSNPKPYQLVLSPEAKAAAESISSLAEVEALTRKELYDNILEPSGFAPGLPPWGFHSFELPNGQRLIAFIRNQSLVTVDLAEEESIGRIEDKNPDLAEALGLSGEIVFPVAARKKGR